MALIAYVLDMAADNGIAASIGFVATGVLTGGIGVLLTSSPP